MEREERYKVELIHRNTSERITVILSAIDCLMAMNAAENLLGEEYIAWEAKPETVKSLEKNEIERTVRFRPAKPGI